MESAKRGDWQDIDLVPNKDTIGITMAVKKHLVYVVSNGRDIVSLPTMVLVAYWNERRETPPNLLSLEYSLGET